MSEDHKSLQLIDEEKHFHADTLGFFGSCVGGRDVGVDYHVISVFGSQSTGKSTLLNTLFHTTFDTMDAEVKREQTTKGIWLSHTQEVNTTGNDKEKTSDIFVLDVEGSDGLERGEDQDFERKAALFAIAVSEVLIVNMWEQQVGLYQGNNMSLLKTVFEVNLSLFGNNKNGHKVLLLFAIRDHLGITPLSSLSGSLTTELEKIWDSLSKPPGCETKTLYDFFDLKFAGLAHKVLQTEKFIRDVKLLGDSFAHKDSESYYFKPEYRQNMPLDGWSLYAANCWDQLEQNKDLDLPTQQILVARFKTEEIANEVFTALTEEFNNTTVQGSTKKDVLIKTLSEMKKTCLTEYDEKASRYSKTVYLEKREELSLRIEDKFMDAIKCFVESMEKELFEKLRLSITQKQEQNNNTTFSQRLDDCAKKAQQVFELVLQEFEDSDILCTTSKAEILNQYNIALKDFCETLRKEELASLVNKSKKIMKLKTKEDLIPLLAHPDPSVWDTIMKSFNDSLDNILAKYKLEDGSFDFQVNCTDEVNKKTSETIRADAWKTLYVAVHDFLTVDTVAGILRDRFENKFRYDENDSPKLWKNEEEIDESFRVAKEYALKVLGVLSLATTSDNIEIVPDVDIMREESTGDGPVYEDDEGIYHTRSFAHILTEVEKEKVLQQFRRQINITVLDSKRSTIKMTTYIPLWVYILIALLGWNEFMIVIRNPLFVTLALISLVSFHFVNRMGLWGPIMNVVQTIVGETVDTIKAQLRQFVLEEHERIPASQKVEEQEMKDLSK